jgi:hypothetical protein
MAVSRIKKKLTPAAQHKRFVRMAKTVGADESPDALDKAFKKLDPRKLVSKTALKRG